MYGATLAGWASYNKWALMGGLRASSQMISYEVTMGMAVLGMFLVYGTLEPGAHGRPAGRMLAGTGASGVCRQPLGFVLFLTAAMAETKRTPFDIPEGEPEIIGYFVEYSGLRFGMFFLGEFIEIVSLERPHGRRSSSAAGTSRARRRRRFLVDTLPNVAFVLATFALLARKVFVFCAFQLLIRWSLPRFRSDQLMQLGWQRLLPVSIVNVLMTAGWILCSQR